MAEGAERLVRVCALGSYSFFDELDACMSVHGMLTSHTGHVLQHEVTRGPVNTNCRHIPICCIMLGIAHKALLHMWNGPCTGMHHVQSVATFLHT